MKITSLTLWVQENTLSEKFYKKVGFKVMRSDDRGSVVVLGNFEIMLVAMRDEPEFARDVFASEKGKGFYINVAVSDVDAVHQKLLKLGLQPCSVPRDWPWGHREFVIKDPDGYKLCFWQASSR